MTEDLKLTPEEQASIDQWNGSTAAPTTDAAMRHFLPSWFANARELIRANFPIQSLEKLVDSIQEEPIHEMALLGSGPSLTNIAGAIAKREHGFPLFPVVMCGPTGVGACQLAGVRPDIIVVADSNPIQYELLRDLYGQDSGPHRKIIVLPVTASPLWYSKDSIFLREYLYFYLPYISELGDTDLAFNHILKALFPEVNRFIAQAGSVSSTMLSLADMIAGDDPEWRINLGFDFCGWLTNPPRYRAPAAKRVYGCDEGDFIEKKEAWHQAQIDAIRDDAIVVSSSPSDIETTRVSLGYAIQILYLLHSYGSGAGRENRYRMFADSLRLYRTLAPGVTIPAIIDPSAERSIDPIAEEHWAYKTLLKVIEYSNSLEVNHG